MGCGASIAKLPDPHSSDSRQSAKSDQALTAQLPTSSSCTSSSQPANDTLLDSDNTENAKQRQDEKEEEDSELLVDPPADSVEVRPSAWASISEMTRPKVKKLAAALAPSRFAAASTAAPSPTKARHDSCHDMVEMCEEATSIEAGPSTCRQLVAPGGMPACVAGGISLSGLRKLAAKVYGHYGEESYLCASTAQVVRDVIQPLTEKATCRLAELPDVIQQADLGVPTYFVSHAWRGRFSVMVQTVEDFLKARKCPDTTRVWIDVVAVNQHTATRQHGADLSSVRSVLQVTSGGTIAVVDVKMVDPVQRAWCVYEWALTLSLRGGDKLHIEASISVIRQMIDHLEIEKAECSFARDKVMIMAEVRRLHGTPAVFDQRIKAELRQYERAVYVQASALAVATATNGLKMQRRPTSAASTLPPTPTCA